MISASVKRTDLNAFRSANILASCVDPCFSEHRPSGGIELETGNADATVHVVFDFEPTYSEYTGRNPNQNGFIADGVESVDVKTVRMVIDDHDIGEICFEPTRGSDLHRDWCKAVLSFVQPHGESLCERFV